MSQYIYQNSKLLAIAHYVSAKGRGFTENPVSDLELNLSETATKAIEFY